MAEPRADEGAYAGRGAGERDCTASAAPAGDARAELEATPYEQGDKGAPAHAPLLPGAWPFDTIPWTPKSLLVAVESVAAEVLQLKREGSSDTVGKPESPQPATPVKKVVMEDDDDDSTHAPQTKRKADTAPDNTAKHILRDIIETIVSHDIRVRGMPSTAPASRSSDHHAVAPREVAGEESTDEGGASAEEEEEEEESEESEESEEEPDVARTAAPRGHRPPQGTWTEHEVQRLKQAFMRHGPDWESVQRDVRTRSVQSCRMKYKLDPKIRQGKEADKSYESDEDGNSGDERVLRAVGARRSAGRVSEPPAPYARQEQRPGRSSAAATNRIPFSEQVEQAQAQSMRPRSQHKQAQRKQHKRAREDAASEASDAEPHRVQSRFEKSLEALVGGLHEHESELRKGFDRRCAELQRQCERLKAAASKSEAKLQAVLKENAKLRTGAEKQGASDDQLRAAHDKLQAAEAKLCASEEAKLKLRAFRAAIEKHTAALDL
jgi:hypothetical protein